MFFADTGRRVVSPSTAAASGSWAVSQAAAVFWPGLMSTTYHPAFASQVRALITPLSADSDVATALTIERMRSIVDRDKRHISIESLARQLCDGLTPEQSVAAIHRWVRTNVRFVQDRDIASALPGVDADAAEVLIPPVHLLRMPQPMGDCDDFSMLVAALCAAASIPCSFATVGADQESPERFSHVYVVAHLPGGDIPLDASHGVRAGWEAPNLYNKFKEWGLGSMRGLGFTFTDSTSDTSGGVDWTSIINAGIKAGTGIAQTVLQKPTYQTGPGGTTVYTGGAGSILPGTTLPGTTAPIIPGVSNSMLLLGGLALVAVILVSKK